MRSSKKNIALKLSTVVVATACFAVMGAALMVSQNFKNLLTLWGEDVQLTVYLSSDSSEASRQKIEKVLKDSGKVGDINYINQTKALGEFRTQLASYAPDISQDDELLKLIPASLQVSLAKQVTVPEQMGVLQNLASQLKGLDGVDEVSYGQDWVAKYSALVTAVELTLQLLGVVIVAAALFVMSNAIRASVQARHEEVVVMEMIGATASMIRKPYLIEGAVLGVFSSSVAMVCCFVLYVGFKSLLITKLSFLQLGQHLTFMTPVTLATLIVGGTLLGALGSYLCVRRINDGWAASQGS